MTVAMTVLPCACGDHLTRFLLGGRTPVRRRPERWFSPWPPTRPGGGSASRKADGAWCPRRPATLRPLGRQGPRPWRPKGRPGAPWRRAPPGPRVRTREVSRRPPTRNNRLGLQATAYATVSHGTDLPASRWGNPGAGAVSRTSPPRPRFPSPRFPGSRSDLWAAGCLMGGARPPAGLMGDVRPRSTSWAGSDLVRGGRATRSGAPGSTTDGGDGALHRARAAGMRGPPPRPSLGA